MTSIKHNHYRPHHQHHMTKFVVLCSLLIANILPSCKCSSNSSKLGVHMIRSPESTIAPLRDEVLFECELNLNPDRLEWRFRSSHSNGTVDDYLYLRKNVNWFCGHWQWREGTLLCFDWTKMRHKLFVLPSAFYLWLSDLRKQKFLFKIIPSIGRI